MNIDLKGAILVDLPVFCPTQNDPLDPLRIEIPDLGYLIGVLIDPSSAVPGKDAVVFASAPDLAKCIADLSIPDDLGSLLDGLDLMLQVLQQALSGEVFGVSLPLVGDHLKDGAQFIEDFRDDVLTRLRGLANHSDDAVRQALFEVFGPAGLGLLRDGADTGADVDLEDIQLVSTPDDVSFSMHLGEDLSLLSVPIDFDIGLPALGLKVDGKVNVRLGWDFQMGFGVSRSDGVYFNATAKDNAGNPIPELTVDLDVTAPGLAAIGSLGFLQLQARDDETEPSRLAGRFTVDVKDPEDDDGRLSFGEMAGGPDLDEVIDAAFTADAHVNLDLDLNLGDNAAFPRLLADFGLDWSFAGADPGASGPFGARPQIAFDNVRLDLGSFLSDVVGPIVNTIDSVAGPIRPVLDVLNTRLPVLSDLGPTRSLLDRNDDGAVTLLEMAALLGDGADSAATFISALSNVLDVADILDGLSNNGDAVLLDFGSFDLGSLDVRGLTDLTAASPNVTRATNPLDQFKNSGTAEQREAAQKLMAAPGGGFVFPIIDNPTSLFGLLMGKDVTLVGYDMPAVNVSLSYSQFFPLLGPLGITLAGSVNVDLDLAFAFDTFGARRFAASGFDPGDAALILDGLYVSDTGKADGTGKDVDEATLRAAIEAFGSVNLGVASAGVGGGIGAKIGLDLSDPNDDGKIRASEFADVLAANPMALFNADGKLTAGLSAFVKIGFGFFSLTKHFNIAEVTLLDFTFGCDPTPRSRRCSPARVATC